MGGSVSGRVGWWLDEWLMNIGSICGALALRELVDWWVHGLVDGGCVGE